MHQEDRSRLDAAALGLATLRRAIATGWQQASVQGRQALQRYFDAGYAPIESGPLAPQPPSLAVTDLSVAYDGNAVIEHITLAFPPGSMVAVVGPNGAGKSTLLKALAGIVKPRSGEVERCGAAAGDIAYLPQSDEVDRSFPVTVGEFVALGQWRRFGAFRPVPAALSAALDEALEAVGLAPLARQSIAALSVGQFRRALFGRLILQRAGALLLDEPFAAIDATTTADLLRLVGAWHAERRTIIAVLHDLAQVRAYFPHTILLARNCIAAGLTAEVLTPANLARAGLAASVEAGP